jgi:hypothetical protein
MAGNDKDRNMMPRSGYDTTGTKRPGFGTSGASDSGDNPSGNEERGTEVPTGNREDPDITVARTVRTVGVMMFIGIMMVSSYFLCMHR